jgi:hypothetical protein
MLADLSANDSYVLVALISGLPAILAAVGVFRVHEKVKTPSGKTIGKQVEDALHVAISNYHQLDAIGGAVSAPTNVVTKTEAAKLDEIANGGEA